jgi:hypothetical protein
MNGNRKMTIFQGGTAPSRGDMQVFAAQLRYALSDRLALIATKNGRIALRPDYAFNQSKA